MTKRKLQTALLSVLLFTPKIVFGAYNSEDANELAELILAIPAVFFFLV